MSTGVKTVLWIVVIVVVVGGGVWWWIAAQNSASNSQSMANMTPEQMANMTSTVATTAASSTPLPQGDSDQAIEQDMNSANAQMNGFSSDSASMDQSLNDQPVQQAE